jgi:hypothetical protein
VNALVCVCNFHFSASFHFSDKPSKPQGQNQSIVDELKKYDVSSFSSTDNDLLAKYGPLLFFRVNEKEYPILSEIAKVIFCLVPSSSPVESILSTTGTKFRNNLFPTQLEILTLP